MLLRSDHLSLIPKLDYTLHDTTERRHFDDCAYFCHVRPWDDIVLLRSDDLKPHFEARLRST